MQKPDHWLTKKNIDSKKRMLWITENIQRNYKLTDSWANRNAIRVDTTGVVWKNKTLIQRVLDSINWVRDENSNLTIISSNPDLKLTDRFMLRENWESNWVPFISAQMVEASLLKDKTKYILNKINNTLDRIEKGDLYNFPYEFLNDCINEWLIDSDQIKEKIRAYLVNKWDEIWNKIVAFKGQRKCVDYLSDRENKILFFCINSWYISHKMAALIPLDDWETIDKYIDKYCKEDLLEVYYKNLFFSERDFRS